MWRWSADDCRVGHDLPALTQNIQPTQSGDYLEALLVTTSQVLQRPFCIRESRDIKVISLKLSFAIIYCCRHGVKPREHPCEPFSVPAELMSPQSQKLLHAGELSLKFGYARITYVEQ